MDAQTGDAAAVLPKGEFARLIGVSAARVSQYIGERKIRGDALVGEGRNAQIRVDLAKAQLREALDLGQRLGNGLDTRLDGPALSPEPPAASSASEADDTPAPDQPSAPRLATVEDQIKRERLESQRRANRNAAREEAEAIGRLTDAEAAQRQMGRIAGKMVTTFEAGLRDMAAAVAGKYDLLQRDVEHLLRAEFRKVRANAAAEMRRVAEELPLSIETDLSEAVAPEDGAAD